MNIVSIYYDICKEIEIYELRLTDLEQDLKHSRKLCFSGQLPSDPLPVHVPLDEALRRYDEVVFKIREVSDALTEKRLIKQRIESSVRKFNGIEYQVAFKRLIENKSLREISSEIGYSYQRVKKISMRLNLPRNGEPRGNPQL